MSKENPPTDDTSAAYLPYLPTSAEEFLRHQGVIRAITEYAGSTNGTLSGGNSLFYIPVYPGTAPEFTPLSGIDASLAQSLLYTGQPIELHASFLERSAETSHVPRGIVMLWDVEHYNNEDPKEPLANPQETFTRIEPIYLLMKNKLASYGIQCMAVMTGKGYHFTTYIPSSSPIYADLVRIGNELEPSVAEKLRRVTIDNLPPQKVSSEADLAFKGATRLQQYVFTQVIHEARTHAQEEVHIADRRIHGIALDNTAATRDITNSTRALIGLYREQNTIAVRIPRAVDGHELDMQDAIRIRGDYAEAAQLLSSTNCQIPNGTAGVANLIAEYDNSGLAILHRAMDARKSREQQVQTLIDGLLDGTYTQSGTPEERAHLKDLIAFPHTRLLEPDHLDFVIWFVFKALGGRIDPANNSSKNVDVAVDVAEFLYIIYTSSTNAEIWQGRWKNFDPMRHARGWVELILGQGFEKGIIE